MSVPWRSEFETVALQCKSRLAVADRDGAVDFEQLYERATTLSAHLSALDVQPGEAVVTLISNSAVAVWASLAITFCGACEVILNPSQSIDEYTWCTRHVGARVLLHDGSVALPRGPALVLDCRNPGRFAAQFALRDPQSSDWGRILFTSGTTGRPKGVVHNHGRRWLANLLLRHSLPPIGTDESILLLTPFSHGSSLLAYAALFEGRSVHLLPGLVPSDVERAIRSNAVQHIFAPPTVLMRLVDMFAGERIGTIRTIFTGTAPLSAALHARASSIFGDVIRITYGMTEAFNPLTVLSREATAAFYRKKGEGAGAVGWPAPGVEISIRDEDGHAVPVGQSGEIFIRARHMFIGYLAEDGDLREAEPFHPTGDIGRLDREFGLWLLGRQHDIIKTGGYKLFAQEVESALASAGIEREIVIIGLPSQHWGQIVTCVGREGETGWEEEVRAAAARMTGYKQPRLFAEVPDLWRNAIGKVDRRRIAEWVASTYELIDGPYPQLHRNRDTD